MLRLCFKNVHQKFLTKIAINPQVYRRTANWYHRKISSFSSKNSKFYQLFHQQNACSSLFLMTASLNCLNIFLLSVQFFPLSSAFSYRIQIIESILLDSSTSGNSCLFLSQCSPLTEPLLTFLSSSPVPSFRIFYRHIFANFFSRIFATNFRSYSFCCVI